MSYLDDNPDTQHLCYTWKITFFMRS